MTCYHPKYHRYIFGSTLVTFSNLFKIALLLLSPSFLQIDFKSSGFFSKRLEGWGILLIQWSLSLTLYVWSTNFLSQKIPTQTIGIISSNSATLVQIYLLKALKCLFLPLIPVQFQIYWSLYTKRSVYTVVCLFMDWDIWHLKKKSWESMDFARFTIKSVYSGVVLKIAVFRDQMLV